MGKSPQRRGQTLSDIFINYRRDDTSGYAGRLEKELSRRFPGRIFQDIRSIEGGVDFVEAIRSGVGRCSALIVLIGNQWLDTNPKTGKRRLDDPDDFVRREIVAALERKVRVIPVLLERAKMPVSGELPTALAKLVRQNAVEITDSRWDYDVEQLIKILEKILKVPAQPGKASEEAKSRLSHGRAVVTFAKAKAEFFFPFDTAANWEWYLSRSKADEMEYRWGIYVERGELKGNDYAVDLILRKAKKELTKTGDLKSLLYFADLMVLVRKPGIDFEEADHDFVKTRLLVQPDGLKIVLSGEGVKAMFGYKPEQIMFVNLTPELALEAQVVIGVQYPRK